jgi:chemotaxis-related protein WspB
MMLVLTFQVGSNHLALEVGRVHKVVPFVRLQPVACSPPWLAGVFIYRGQLVPVIDLHRLLGVGECPVHLSTRIILVPHVGKRDCPFEEREAVPLSGDRRERLLGLLAAKVADVRDMQPSSPLPTRLVTVGRPDLGPILVDGQEIIHLVELDRLLPELSGQEFALAPKEAPA